MQVLIVTSQNGLGCENVNWMFFDETFSSSVNQLEYFSPLGHYRGLLSWTVVFPSELTGVLQCVEHA